ncbi:hypothetical protein [Flammeovirga kamogawensis]|uniref:Uncharacterized protein n=1 Tax=Flammeovirga kamogawensis TaxID=373891 RepID=A0ABX8GS01_9BACT|nr:hypothetical protein [Flammeovirga kamogawensis]MBB6463699.1 hypothetical protein [Flammeovirga kamogawensis]QWG06199.1 hypothetical protein KM029_12700 [Flammeovirga kamogawensis]TRX68030.1 hypothetical protein EO216_07720 [Flammeovirga kamogawensis]
MGLFDFLRKRNNSIERLKRFTTTIESYLTRLEDTENTFITAQEKLSKPLPNHMVAILERKLVFHDQISELFNQINTLKSIESSDPDFQLHLESAIKNLGALNAVSEMELKDANNTLIESNNFQSSYLSNSDMSNVHKEISLLKKENLNLQDKIKELMNTIDLNTI